MVPGGLGGERQLLRAGLRQGAGRYRQEGLVPGWLARERQLLHPLRSRSQQHPGNTGTFKPLRSRPTRGTGRARRVMIADPATQSG
jgi:hypothetical protein